MFLRRRIVFIRDVALERILKLAWDCHNARQGKGEHFMKKRRLSAFVIALALAVGSVSPAFAAEHIVDTSKKGSLTIYEYDITGARQSWYTGRRTGKRAKR